MYFQHIEALRSMKLKHASVAMRDGPDWEVSAELPGSLILLRVYLTARVRCVLILIVLLPSLSTRPVARSGRHATSVSRTPSGRILPRASPLAAWSATTAGELLRVLLQPV